MPCYGRAVNWRRARAVTLGVWWLALTPVDGHASVWPSAQRRLVSALESTDVIERRGAAARLLELPPKLARELATKSLRDDDVEVRLHAAQSAGALGIEGAASDVVEWLQDRDPRLREAACVLIGSVPTASAVQALGRVLSDAKPEVREAAATAMGKSGISEAAAPLVGHLDDAAVRVRVAVVRALGRLGSDKSVVPLLNKLHDQDAEVRRETARALGVIGERQAVPTLVLALEDKSPDVRIEALEALGRLGAEDAVSAITAQLSPLYPSGVSASSTVSDPIVREAALTALGRLKNAAAIAALTAELEAEGPVPYASGAFAAPARAALLLAGEVAADALSEVLRSSGSARLSSAAALALGQHGGEHASASIMRATERGGVSLAAALDALDALGDAEALPFVLEHFEDPDLAIRARAIDVATRLLDPKDRDGRAVDVVRARVVDLSLRPAERVPLVRLLGKTGSPRALPILLSLTGSRSLELRHAVFEALGELAVESVEVDRVLLEALESHHERLRSSAAKALARVGRAEAATVLIERIRNGAEADRDAVGLAISGALAGKTDAGLVLDVSEALPTLAGRGRDALIEGLGRMESPAAARLLAELASASDVNDRRKVAEALAGHATATASAMLLLADRDPAVRANAAWSLATIGTEAAIAPLRAALLDPDASVAGNATVALARVTARTKGPDVTVALVRALDDPRSYVRAGAIAGLSIARSSCEVEALSRALRADPSWRVRLTAAAALHTCNDRSSAASATAASATSASLTQASATSASLTQASATSASVTQASATSASLDVARELRRRISGALARCSVEETNARVAERCAAAPHRAAAAGVVHPVLVYVVPDTATNPVAGAAFALVFADGAMRLGVADRRGAVFERSAPTGRLELAVPAALAR
ncbi:MAG: HEAT repeat domain-containing protein [Myxococcales bacterium]|nr:HEAT repeat domain-containing protein [Myxococcales bacterium]